MEGRAQSAYPDGISEEHSAPPRGLTRHANPLSLGLLGLLIVLAFAGVLGGQPQPTKTAETGAARIEVNSPDVIRNGEFFETRIVVTPRRAFADLVIGVTPSLWRDLTVNTMIPGAAEESFADGAYRFSYGPTEAGAPLVIKIDSQINPSLFGGTSGRFIVYDGEAAVAELPIAMRVLP